MNTELMLDHIVKQLKMPTIGRQYRSLAREAEERNLSYEGYLLALLETELQTREENQRQRRLKQASFPVQKTLDTYDFSLMPSLNKNRFIRLAKGEFVEKKENLIFLGNSGPGKTHLAITLGIEMIQNGYKTKFITASELVEELLMANEEHKLGAFEKKWLTFEMIALAQILSDKTFFLKGEVKMRQKIIRELASEYEKEEIEIENIIKNHLIIPRYKFNQINGRKVINKSDINFKEIIVLEYYKLLINRLYNLNFPNRSYIMAEIMNIMPSLHMYFAYTIFKFDFKHFFYNISPKKSFEIIYEALNLKTFEYNFLKNYTSNIKELTPGIGLHNTLVEVSGKIFDLEIKKAFKENCLYYARYVDDCILIIDENIERNKIEKIIFKLIKHSFGNKVKINTAKTYYYNSLSTNFKFDYLGYEFEKGQSENSKFKFGIANSKLDKYTKVINEIILEYKATNNLEVLNLKLELFFKRIVYYGARKNSKRNRWQVRGISDSYKELKRFMKNNEDFSKITRDTKNFFNETIERCFLTNRVIMPAKIKNQVKNQKFISCFLNNKALLLHQKIGLKHDSLKNKVSVFYNENLENYSYNELANKLLAKIKY